MPHLCFHPFKAVFETHMVEAQYGAAYMYYFLPSAYKMKDISRLIVDANNWERVEDDEIRQSFDPVEHYSCQDVCRICDPRRDKVNSTRCSG